MDGSGARAQGKIRAASTAKLRGPLNQRFVSRDKVKQAGNLRLLPSIYRRNGTR